MAEPNPGAAYNVCDDEPAPPQDVIAYAAALLACSRRRKCRSSRRASMSPMARSFYADSKRVANSASRASWACRLRYPGLPDGAEGAARRASAWRRFSRSGP